MKKPLLACLLSVCMLLCCTSTGGEQLPPDFSEFYDPLIRSVCDYLFAGMDDGMMPPDMFDLPREFGPQIGHELGYALVDFAGDEGPELVFARIDHDESGVSKGRDVVAAFAWHHDRPELLFRGRPDNRFLLVPGGVFNYDRYSDLGGNCTVFHVRPEKPHLTAVEGYDYEYLPETDTHLFARVMLDKYGQRVYKAINVTPEDFENRCRNLAKDAMELTLCPLLDYYK